MKIEVTKLHTCTVDTDDYRAIASKQPHELPDQTIIDEIRNREPRAVRYMDFIGWCVAHGIDYPGCEDNGL